MALFEVFIPAADENSFNITARIRADSWIQALRNGLSRLGDTTDVRNVMCDITEQGIDVTEPQSGRVFRIRELPDAEPAKSAAPPAPVATAAPKPAPIVGLPPPAAKPQAITAAPPPAAPRAAAPAVAPLPPPAARPQPKAPVESAAVTPARSAQPARVSAAPVAAIPVTPKPMPPLVTPAPARFQGLVEEETIKEERPSGAAPVAIGRGKVAPTRSIEDIIGDLFEATQQMYDKSDYREAAEFILALAHKNIPSDSGAVFISDFNRGDMFFASATGPKAKEVMRFRVGMGQGIVGFSAQEGVSLAVSDVHRDPRFYAKISQSLGYETKSILCAPAHCEGRVYGAIELINKNNGTSFSSDEINLLNYLAHEFADYLMNTGQPGDIA